MIDHPEYRDGLKPHAEKFIRGRLDEAISIDVNQARRLLGQLYKEREKLNKVNIFVKRMIKKCNSFGKTTIEEKKLRKLLEEIS